MTRDRRQEIVRSSSLRVSQPVSLPPHPNNSEMRDSHKYIQKQVWGYNAEKAGDWWNLSSIIVRYDSAHPKFLETICVHSNVAQIWVVATEGWEIASKVEFNDHDVDSKVFPINGDLRTSDNYDVRRALDHEMEILCQDQHQPQFYSKSFLDK